MTYYGYYYSLSEGIKIVIYNNMDKLIVLLRLNIGNKQVNFKTEMNVAHNEQ